MRPAALVLGLAVLIVGGFIAIGFATNGPATQTTTSKATHVIAGTTLRARPGAPDLSVITASG